ncbi:MAG TPA: UbiA family prenyltransferase, partial [Chitinophagales bacterium]|nr:UbiA family prenyltransferase [Chitinophagales bacterium]
MKLLRANIWWNAIVPQVLAWVYLFFAVFYWQIYTVTTGHVYYYRSLQPLAAFLLTLFSVSAFGYLFNDICDIESDRRAGKKNMAATYSTGAVGLLALILLAAGAASWMWYFQFDVFALLKAPSTWLLLLQVASLVAYSLPPVRLKERGLAGVIADAFYGHLNPALITISLFYFGVVTINRVNTLLLCFYLVVIMLWFIKGLRNILLHQIEDRKRDRRSGVKTYIASHSALATVNFINRVILPTEAAFLLVFVFICSYELPPFFLSFIFFAIVSYLKFSGWKLAYLPKRQLKFKFLYFLNDYYEGWLPVSLLIILSVYD